MATLDVICTRCRRPIWRGKRKRISINLSTFNVIRVVEVLFFVRRRDYRQGGAASQCSHHAYNPTIHMPYARIMMIPQCSLSLQSWQMTVQSTCVGSEGSWQNFIRASIPSKPQREGNAYDRTYIVGSSRSLVQPDLTDWVRIRGMECHLHAPRARGNRRPSSPCASPSLAVALRTWKTSRMEGWNTAQRRSDGLDELRDRSSISSWISFLLHLDWFSLKWSAQSSREESLALGVINMGSNREYEVPSLESRYREVHLLAD